MRLGARRGALSGALSLARAVVVGFGVLVSGASVSWAEDLGGGIKLTIYRHASFLLEWQGVAIYIDPSRGDPFGSGPAPDLILVTRGRQDHLDVDKIRQAITTDTLIAGPAIVSERRIRPTLGALGCWRGLLADLFHCAPDGWEELLVTPGDEFMVRGVGVEVFAGGHDGERPGCCVSYVLTLGAVRIFIAGETSANADMLGLTDIDVAFLPLRPRSRFGAGQAAAAIAAFRPRVVYPYLYLWGDRPEELATLAAGIAEIRVRDWY